MLSAVDQFRLDLTLVVRRLSRDKIHENAIDEMVSHFDGLLQEGCGAEPNEKQAEQLARKRMGSLYRIAFQIVNTPDRVQRGVRFQLVGCVLFLSLVLAYNYATTRMDMNFVSHLPEVVRWIEVLFVFAGLLAGIGLLMARRLIWRPLAVAAVVAVAVGGFIIDQSVPEFKLNRQQMTAIADRQARLDPKVSPIEDQAKVMMGRQDQSPDAWRADSEKLTSLVQTAKVEFLEEEIGSTGAYLYPTKIDYPHDYAVMYSMKLSRTNDLAVAKNGWHSDTAPAAFVSAQFEVRRGNLKAWQKMAANYSTLWTWGYQISAKLSFAAAALYLLVAFGGAAIGRLRIYGFDWLRLSRG